jgi:hypothetical protein
MHFSKLLAAATAMFSLATAIEVIEMKDRHFYGAESGDPFFIRGVDYQPGGSAKFKKGRDPLSDINTCARDIYLFQKLGINTIRVYSVDPELNHDECMTLLAQAGIYLVLDVNSPLENEHLNNQEPWTTYTPNYLEHIFKVVDQFSGYANTLAFLAGNEVIFEEISAKASPNYVKAVVRDLKAYITNHVSRVIPVGYSNADDLNYRSSLAHYLECGEVGYIDFFGVNSYQWCGKSSFEGSGYDKLVEDYSNYSLPVFFTEYGCNESPPRQWEEVGALYSDKMTGVFSGGLVYEFSQESNNYGLVEIGKDGSVETMKDYERLVAAYKKVDSKLEVPSSMKKVTRPTTCPDAKDPMFKHIKANMTLPFTLNAGAIKDGVKVTRGKFVDVSTRSTKYKITYADKTVTNKAVESKFPTNNEPLKAGGHGKNTGGGVGEGAPTTSDSESSSESAAASGATASQGLMFVGSLVTVALGFGVFL